MNRRYYFAYGANMAYSSMKSRCPLAEPMEKMTLRGWRLDFGHHATIVPDADAVCDGVLWKITEYCERSLDAFEGYPSYYDKLYLEQDGLPFMAYEMTDLDRRHMPSQSYIECLREGYDDWKLDHSLLDCALDFDCLWTH
jgi:gamma-glutamylcyclotransferase